MRKVLLFLICINAIALFGQSGPSIENLTVTLPGNECTIDSIFACIKKQHGIVFSYGSSLNLSIKMRFDKTVLTVNEIFKTISAQAEVNFKIKGNKVLFYSKKKKHIVSGLIKDSANGEVMPGAHVRVDNSNFGAVADAQGYYNLKLEEGDHILSFSFLGYETVDKPVSVLDETGLNIDLVVSANNIDEVKVTRQRNLWRNMEVGRNISSLDSKKIESLNTNNAADILQASIPGVWSTQTSGAPGDHQKVKIRGVSSIFGCTDPLYIIDGVAVPIVNLHSLGIADLNIYDIETITVLKDASSNAIYGYQGGNGVIIIDTKRGKENHISFSTKYGIQRVPKRYDLMNTKDFLTTMDSAKVNNVTILRDYYPAYNDTLSNSDWQDVVFQDGILKEYQLSGSGTIGKTSCYLSGNYYTHQGIVANSNYERYTASANLGRNITEKLSLELNIRNSLQKNKNNLDTYNGNNLLISGINKSPCLINMPDSFYIWPRNPSLNGQEIVRTYYDYTLFSTQAKKKPTDSVINNNINTLEILSNAFDLRAKYSLLDNLYLNAVSSVTFRDHTFQSDIKYGGYGQKNFMKSTEHYILFNQQINLNYLKSKDRHELLLTSGYRNYADNVYWNLDSINNNDYPDDLYLKNSLAINANHGSVIRQIHSFSALANYNFSKKYFISLVANYEYLAVNKVIEYKMLYPSVALSWDISHENIFNQLNWLNEFSVFSNWGRVGNMPINALAMDSYSNYRYNYNDTIINGRAIEQFANHYMKPEIIDEYNLGVNTGFFNNRIRFTADYYYKISEDLILIREIPLYYAGGRMMINVGKVVNQGKEINLEADVVSTTSFLWSTNFALSTNKLRVEKVGVDSILEFYSDDVLIPQFEVKEDAELGVIKGYKYIGVFTSADYKARDKNYINSGGGKYLNADTTNINLTTDDMVVLGKTMPDFTWHWQNTFTYKNLSLEMLWYGVVGVDKYNSTKAATYMAGTNREINNFFQSRNKTLATGTFYRSSYFVEDASFVRLKQLTISYLIPKKIFNKADLRVSLSFENMLTLTKYTGYDPEATIYTDNSFSDYAVDRGAYPNPKSVYFTLNLDF